ncbi:MAG TPA: hypothetical protein VFS97_04890 [Nitrososphaeraceae archaeon]|nr:hypothetical protein [Nitrososphaeraceae archaeon]
MSRHVFFDCGSTAEYFIPQSMYIVIIYYPLDNFLTQLHSDKEDIWNPYSSSKSSDDATDLPVT